MLDLDDVFELRRNTDGAYTIFCDHILSAVVGKNLWKSKSAGFTISKIATVSDEAFALLLLVNSWDLWTETDATATTKQSKYTRNGAGTKKNEGWTRDGLVRFNELAKMVKMDRSMPHATTFEADYMAEKESKIAIKGRRREKESEDSVVDQFCTYIEGDDDDEDDVGCVARKNIAQGNRQQWIDHRDNDAEMGDNKEEAFNYNDDVDGDDDDGDDDDASKGCDNENHVGQSEML